MTGPLFTDLEQLAAQALRENERMCARIAQLEHQLAVCQADRDRAREAEKLLLELTPGGSEFHGSPGICANWIRDRLHTTMKIAKERNQLREAGGRLASSLQVMLDEHGWYHPELPEEGRGSCAACCSARANLAAWRGETGEPEGEG